MGTSWLPLTDLGLLAFVTPFSAQITATPAAFGLVAGDATTLAGLRTTYQSALAVVDDQSTRTPSAVTAKDVAKSALVAEMRSLARRIQANPSVTPEQKTDLGLPIHKTTPTKITAPVTKPVVSLAGTPTGFVVPVRLADETTPTKKAKPFGVDGAEVYSYVLTGTEEPPADLEQWRFEGIAKRDVFQIGYNAADEGKTTVIRSRWFNPRGEAGPVSTPITAKVAA